MALRGLLLVAAALLATIPIATPAGDAKLPVNYHTCGKCGGKTIDKGKGRHWCPEEDCEHYCAEGEQSDGSS